MPDEQEAPTPPQKRLYTYGVRRSKKTGELQAFWGKGEYGGTKALALHQMLADSTDAARIKAEELLAAWKDPQDPDSDNQSLPLRPGVFCVHSDSDGHHNCLIIGHTNDPEPLFHVLMLTTNPRWNRHCRPATEVEIAQLIPQSRLQSWLAPVSRPVSEFFLASRMTDPSTLVRYWEEFGQVFERHPLGTLTPNLKKALNAWARWYSERVTRIQRELEQRGQRPRQGLNHSRHEQDLFEALGCHPEPFRFE